MGAWSGRATVTFHGYIEGTRLAGGRIVVKRRTGVAVYIAEPEHAVVEVLDPALDGLAVAQLDRNGHFAVAERLKVERFLTGFARRGRLRTPA